MNHLAIKNLSIALEALSRINGYDAVAASTKVMDLLNKELEQPQEITPAPRHRPKTDDDIPF